MGQDQSWWSPEKKKIPGLGLVTHLFFLQHTEKVYRASLQKKIDWEIYY